LHDYNQDDLRKNLERSNCRRWPRAGYKVDQKELKYHHA